MKKAEIFVLGGGPAGIVAALTAKKHNRDKKVILVKKQEKSLIPCGIPYIFYQLNSVNDDIMSDKSLIENDIKIIVDEVLEINSGEKEVIFKSGKKNNYDKLILATGSKPKKLDIEGSEMKGVWYVKKDYEYIRKMKEAANKSKNIAIIGGGFIGVEFADELSNINGSNITIFESSFGLLSSSFNKQYSEKIKKILTKKGVKIETNCIIKKLEKKNNQILLKYNNGQSKIDMVIISIGSIPEVELAKKIGLDMGEYGAIKVNSYQETSLRNVYAIGDCSETNCSLVNKCIPTMLASTACYEARIVANNIYNKNKNIKNNGVLSVFSTSINNHAFASVGLTESQARNNEIDYYTSSSIATNHHPGKLQKTEKIEIKLIISKENNKIIGAQVDGPESVGEIINIIALAIQKDMTIYDLELLQIATHPLLTPSPTVYPLIAAVNLIVPKE